jgi:hypothetical protein
MFKKDGFVFRTFEPAMFDAKLDSFSANLEIKKPVFPGVVSFESGCAAVAFPTSGRVYVVCYSDPEVVGGFLYLGYGITGKIDGVHFFSTRAELESLH